MDHVRDAVAAVLEMAVVLALSLLVTVGSCGHMKGANCGTDKSGVESPAK